MGIYADRINDISIASLPVVATIQRAVANRFNTPLDELLGESLYRPLVLRRQLAIYLCAMALGNRHGDIGRAFNRDRTTVIYSIQRIARIIKIDAEFAAIVEDLATETGTTKSAPQNPHHKIRTTPLIKDTNECPMTKIPPSTS